MTFSMIKSKWVGIALAASTVVITAGCGSNPTSNTSGASNGTGTTTSTKKIIINETGSSLIYPLFTGQWIPAYQSVDANVSLTGASTGSGAGISQAVAGTVQIGASDAYMPTAQMQQNPSIINIPLTISAQQVMYNLPGISQHVQLSGPVLAKIYEGKITNWNDPEITSINPGVKLPNHAIIPVHRSDSSGDSFLFTQFLSDTDSTWSSQVSYSTSPSWPSVSGGVGAQGNDGVVQALASDKYSVGYVGISWLDKATQQGLGYAALENKDGKYVLPTSANIQAGANAMISKVPDDERISLVDSPGANSYPITNFEYAIVNTKQSADMASAMKKFLDWAIDPNGGNNSKYLTPVHFLPLPASIQPKSQAQINKIGG